MLSVKSTTPKKINGLHLKSTALKVFLVAFFFVIFGAFAIAQDNSPYSRYGIGDLVPSTNVAGRGMGGVSAGFVDPYGLSINFNNPASYGHFQSFKEAKSKKLVSGRTILDIGMNFENRTLREPTNPLKFTASNALFSHLQVGVPLSSKWGLSFGLRPVSRISYKIFKTERLIDPNTGQPIDSAYTENRGDGGSYLVSVGTGYKFVINDRQSLAIGLNTGFLFGKKDYSTRRTLLNDTVEYYRGNFETRTTFGNLYFNAGIQYRIQLKKSNDDQSLRFLTIGAHGNWGQTLNAKQDIIRETFFVDANTGNTQLDSVSIKSDIKGKIEYPASYTIGFVYEKLAQAKQAGWSIAIDYMQQNWSKYRFYGQTDLVQNKWEVRVGGQLQPVPKRNYFSNVAYRAGFFFGPDYVNVQQKLQQFGGSFGLGLPLAQSRQAPGQATVINVALEYIKRGNNDNLLKENLFRLSLGFSLSDLWFIKRKYD
jgi:hypothetical protein